MSKQDTPDFWPEDTDTAFYLQDVGGWMLADILARAQAKWTQTVTAADLWIETEYFHVYCVGYDQYDSSDWARFLKVSRLDKSTAP